MAESGHDKPSWANYFKFSFDGHNGYVNTLSEANDLIREYEIATTTSYVSTRDTGKFGVNDIKDTKHKVRWEDALESSGTKLEFDGVPFLVVGCKVLECRHGPDRDKARKAKTAAKKQQTHQGDHSYGNRAGKSRKVFQNTVKFGCSARIILREVVKFPKFKIDKNTKGKKEYASKLLRNAIDANESIEQEHRIYISLPKQSDHSRHVIGKASGLMQQLDCEIIRRIHELVEEGIRSVDEMERHLRIFVTSQLFAGKTPPDISNRRFYPTKLDIRNHMYRAVLAQSHSLLDQEDVERKVEEWKETNPEDSFFFRPSTVRSSDDEEAMDQADDEDSNDEVRVPETEASKSLLFVHQTKWQKELLQRYGNDHCLLDATYKTSKYALPLFFLCVKTNVNYTVVGSFVVESESCPAITEALSILKSWNSEWSPEYFMVDFSEPEIQALEATFPDALVLLCDFHREQAWLRWVSKQQNGVSMQKEEVLAKLRRIASASTEQAYKDALNALRTSEIWNHSPRLQVWFNRTWLPEAKVYGLKVDSINKE